MNRLGFISAVLFIFCASICADETCDQALHEGKTLYKSGKYKQAKEMFDFVVSECGSSYGSAASWSNKCATALNPAKKTTTPAKTTTPTKTTTPAKTTTPKQAEEKKQNIVLSSHIIKSDSCYFQLLGTLADKTEKSVGSETLRNLININQRAKTGAISSLGKGVIVHGRNGLLRDGIPDEFRDTLIAIHLRGEEIIDVTMSNNMKYYCVVYDKNKYFANAPQNFKNKLDQYANKKDVFQSVTINDKGEFIIITKDYYASSSNELQEFLKDVQGMYGYIYSANLSNNGIVVCAENGIRFKNIPPKVHERMQNALDSFRIKIVKFTDSGSCLITDGKRRYRYYL